MTSIRPEPCSEITRLHNSIRLKRNLMRIGFPIPIPCPELAESIRDPHGYQQRAKAKQLQKLADDVHRLRELETATRTESETRIT